MNEGGEPEPGHSVLSFCFTMICTDPTEDTYVITAEVVQANGVTGRVVANHSSLEAAEQNFAANEETAGNRGFKCAQRDTQPGENWVSMSRWIRI